MERKIFGLDETNESNYVVRGSLEMDWSKGKSCNEHNREKDTTSVKPKAVIKSAANGNIY